MEGKMQSNDDFRKDDLASLKEKAEKDLFEVIGAKDVPDEEKGAILAKMVDVITGRAIARLGEELSPEDRQEMEELIGADKTEEVNSFILEKAPNFDTYFEEEAKKLRQELIIELGQ